MPLAIPGSCLLPIQNLTPELPSEQYYYVYCPQKLILPIAYSYLRNNINYGASLACDIDFIFIVYVYIALNTK